MAQATKSKSRPKSKPKSAPKTKRAKSTAKKSASKSAAKKLQSASGKVASGYRRVTVGSRKIDRPKTATQFGQSGSTRSPRFAAAAERASELVCTDADGKPTNRARVGTVQVENVSRKLCKSRSASAVLKSAGFNNVKDAAQYADGKVTLSEAGADASELTKLARRNGDPAKTKISGRALVAALVGLATHKPARK